jgi:phospholipase C
MQFDAPSALLGGEALLARIYNAIRSSSSSSGSNCFNTLFMVVFDEHGGTYDHVPPPDASPPDPAAPAGQMGFTFNRLGVRLPAIAVSPWVSERTVVNDVYHHSSMIRTMRERWNLGKPFTGRDADAPDIGAVLTREGPRAPEDWPEVHPQLVPDFDESLIPPDAPLSPLAKAYIGGGVALARQLNQSVPDIPNLDELKGREALAMLHESIGHLFPGLKRSG